MSYGAFGSTINTFAKGAIGGVPQRESAVLEAVGNILAFPFSTDLLDKSGNGQVIDAGTTGLGNTYFKSATNCSHSYDGNNMLLLDQDGATSAPRITAASQAHQVPHTSPVTFGGFMMGTNLTYTLQLFGSGPGSNSSNYCLQLQSSAGWRFQGNGVTNMGVNFEETPAGRWFHICLAIDSTSRGTGSNAAEFYLNGQPVWSGDVVASQPVNTTDVYSFSCDQDETDPDIQGFMANVFVTDTVLDRTTIRALSDESFGHASPYVSVIP